MPWTAPENPRPVRSKWYVASVTLAKHATTVVMRVVTRGADNKEWASASPSGELRIDVANEVAAEQFFPDQEWIFEMRPVAPEDHGREGME